MWQPAKEIYKPTRAWWQTMAYRERLIARCFTYILCVASWLRLFLRGYLCHHSGSHLYHITHAPWSLLPLLIQMVVRTFMWLCALTRPVHCLFEPACYIRSTGTAPLRQYLSVSKILDTYWYPTRHRSFRPAFGWMSTTLQFCLPRSLLIIQILLQLRKIVVCIFLLRLYSSTQTPFSTTPYIGNFSTTPLFCV